MTNKSFPVASIVRFSDGGFGRYCKSQHYEMLVDGEQTGVEGFHQGTGSAISRRIMMGTVGFSATERIEGIEQMFFDDNWNHG
ncbi:hypothetical protein PT974_03041 [Cladobotryum mycophilum]|uniref:Uncharacterized protein n=1 Tax=Cladobotryum mycophilum TaxID=491253 RepID=A0ABR0SWK6_9HYPO